MILISRKQKGGGKDVIEMEKERKEENPNGEEEEKEENKNLKCRMEGAIVGIGVCRDDEREAIGERKVCSFVFTPKLSKPHSTTTY